MATYGQLLLLIAEGRVTCDGDLSDDNDDDADDEECDYSQ